ncbi:uncharacterized protein LOC118506385 [Anopheles stephensi]|uniref:uncharacterized protein LOC118506385 n=1 Tax=Anopheles stephensi TaxID=30069 RepID=UPI001658780D|nr:uncharacterized protein LOC118506385 [Anopheles stephensi]
MASVLSAPSVTIPAMNCASCKDQGATLVCSTCGTFYCNVPCQVKHWPMHRDFCMPRLVMASPLLGTAAYVGQQITPTTRNVISKSCNDKPNPPSMVPKPQDETNNGNNSGKMENSLPSTVKVNDSLQLEAKRRQQKTISTATMLNDRTAKMPSTEKNPPSMVPNPQDGTNNGNNSGKMENSPPAIVKLNDSLLLEAKRRQQKMISKMPSAEKNVDQKAVGCAATEKTMAAKSVGPSVEKQMPKPIVPGANDTKTKVSMAQGNIRPALAQADDQKSDSAGNSQQLQQAPFPKPGSKVLISYVADDKIYIYEAGPGPKGEPNSFELLIARSIECSRSVQSYVSVPPTVGDIVFAAYDGDHYRAVVKSIGNATVEVFYPDFGNSQTVQWNTLKEIPDPKIKYANCLTHAVWVQNVPSFTKAMKQFLNSLVDMSEFMLYTVIDVHNNGVKMVEMYQCSEQYYLSEKLRNFNLQAMPTNKELSPQQQHTSKYVITNPNTYKPVFLEELIDTESIEGKGIELVIINASESQLSVVTTANYTLYTAMLKDSDVYGKIDPNPYEPKENEVCLVERDGIWYRAIALRGADDEPNFYLLDELQCIGAEDIEIRRYPPGLTRKQFIVECVVENTNVLLEAMGGSDANADKLSGRLMKADVHQSQGDEDTYETTHLTIVSIGQ